MKIRKVTKKDLRIMDNIYLEGVIDELRTQYPKRSKLSIIQEINKYKKQRIIDFGKDIKSQNQYWVVVKIGKEIVGFANAEIKNKEGWLRMLYVKKDFRKKGIGRKLTLERINWLKKKGIKKVSAGMLIKNNASRNNLEKLGFKPISIKLEKKLK